MSAHARTRKTKHRYNEREEEMRVAMMLRRSWGRYRRHVKHFPRFYGDFLAKFLSATFVPGKVDNPEPGVYVWEWHHDPLDKSGGVVDTTANPS